MVRMYSCCGYSDINEFKSSDTIAIKGLNTNPQIAFLAYVKEKGLDINEYSNMLNKIPENESISMLKNANGEIAGAILSYPVSNEAEKIDNVLMVADFKDVIHDYNLGNCLCANSDFYNNNYEIVLAFEKAHDEIMDSWEESLDKNADLLSERYGCDKEEILNIMKSLPPTKEITGYDKLCELMYESGMLDKPATKFKDLPNYDKIPH